MPEPVIEREVSSTTWSPTTRTTGGGVAAAVLAPRPASMLPREDHSRMSPPPSVNTRDWLTRKSSSTKARTLPPRAVTMPSSDGRLGETARVGEAGVDQPAGREQVDAAALLGA